MTDALTATELSSGGGDPATRALATAMPVIRRHQRMGWIWVVLILVVSIVLGVMLIMAGGDALGYGIGVLIVGPIMSLWPAETARKKIEREVLPTVCETFGLTYSKDADEIFQMLPRSFIPFGGRRSCDDTLSGQLAGQWFRLAEVKTETGGKNSQTLFRGVVITLHSRGKPPEFLMASHKETKGFLFFKGNVRVEGMQNVDTVSGPEGVQYGVWIPEGATTDAARLRPVVKGIADLVPDVLHKSTLYSIYSANGEWHIALRHDRDLFSVGGLRASEAQIMADIRSASDDLAQVYRLIEGILKAEEGLI